MSIEEDWAVEQVRELAQRVKRLEDETGITEADRKEAKERREAERAERDEQERQADEDQDDDDGTVKLTPRQLAERQAEVDTQAQADQARADNDGPAGITEKSREKAEGQRQDHDEAARQGEPGEGRGPDVGSEGEDHESVGGTDELYDPAEHTLNEVKAHLRKVDPDERRRIIEAERSRGPRARAGLIGDDSGT